MIEPGGWVALQLGVGGGGLGGWWWIAKVVINRCSRCDSRAVHSGGAVNKQDGGDAGRVSRRVFPWRENSGTLNVRRGQQWRNMVRLNALGKTVP